MDNIQVAKEIRTAIKQGDTQRVMMLISTDIDRLNIMTPFGTWLHVAASEGKLEIVKDLIELGSDVNRRGGIFDAGAIKEAASEGHIEIVKYLLVCGSEMDISEPERNPLFGAIYGGHKDIVELLIDSGIDISVNYTGKRMKNIDAYAFAIERGQREIAALLKARL